MQQLQLYFIYSPYIWSLNVCINELLQFSFSPILYLHRPVACFNRTIVRDTRPWYPSVIQTNKQFSQIDFQSFKYFLNKFVSNSWLIVHANQPDTLLDSWTICKQLEPALHIQIYRTHTHLQTRAHLPPHICLQAGPYSIKPEPGSDDKLLL